MAEEETVTIAITEYRMLMRDRRELNQLYAAGVDNWDGFDFAFEEEED